MQIISQQLRIFVCFILGIIYQCRVCRLTFSQQKFLSKHSKKCKDGEFKCTQCYKGFASQQNLKTHCSRVHQEHRYECSTCGKVSNQKFNIKTHMLVHSDTMDYTCDQMGNNSSIKTVLQCTVTRMKKLTLRALGGSQNKPQRNKCLRNSENRKKNFLKTKN